MNHWKGTVVLKKDPVLQKKGDQMVYFFKACNTEELRDPSGSIIATRRFWLECVWPNPEHAQICRFKAKSMVYLEGALYEHDFTREDGTEGVAIALEITVGVWSRQMKGINTQEADSSADRRGSLE